MLTLKILLACFGMITAVCGVVFEKKDAQSKRLTWAGKLLALLAVFSFILAGLLQYFQDRSEAEKRQQIVLEELQKQNELIQAVRRSSVLLEDKIGISCNLKIISDSPLVTPYLQRLAGSPQLSKSPSENHIYFSSDDSLAPDVNITAEWALASSLHKWPVSLIVYANDKESPLAITFNPAHIHFFYDNIEKKFTAYFTLTDADIMSSGHSTYNFGDLPGKSFRLIFHTSCCLDLDTLTLFSKSRVAVTSKNIRPLTYHDFKASKLSILQEGFARTLPDAGTPPGYKFDSPNSVVGFEGELDEAR